MLKQELCQACMKQATTTGWNHFDDGNWSHGFVVCPSMRRRKPGTQPIFLDAPDWCPYALEHVILGSQNAV